MPVLGPVLANNFINRFSDVEVVWQEACTVGRGLRIQESLETLEKQSHISTLKVHKDK